MTGQEAFLAGHCPLTGRYFEPWPDDDFTRQGESAVTQWVNYTHFYCNVSAQGVSQKIKKFGNLMKLGISVSMRHSDRS